MLMTRPRSVPRFSRLALLLIPGLFFAFSAPVRAQSGSTTTAGSAAPERRFALTFTSGASWSPSSIEVHQGLVLFKAWINGRDATVLLDNGAANTFVNAGFIRRAGGSPGQDSYSAQTGSTTLQGYPVKDVTFVVPNQVRIAGTLVALDLAPFSKIVGRPIDAVLGADVMRHLAVMVRPIDKTLYLVRTGKMTPKNGARASVIPIIEGNNVEAAINGKPVRLAIDLGSNGIIQLSRQAWSQVIPAQTATSTQQVSGGDGVVQALKAVSNASFQLGAVRADNVTVTTGATLPVETQGLLGTAFLSKFNIILDLGQKKLILPPL
ncbi:aspartyl protease family protein [Sphingomonas sp. Leaf38]|uniref:aspartyl protease family protein n=1 Tax=Sphingomonas sp. Leaf38 TaxID=1736217 RepID=UPI000ADD759D|nr:aspartyl protease family protein [Sphingomonas sp. Leaf38]